MPRFNTEGLVGKRLALSGNGSSRNGASQGRGRGRGGGRAYGGGYGRTWGRGSSAFYGMGDTITTPTVKDPIDQVLANTNAIITQQKAEAHARKIALIIAGASALFAAARLGIVAFPLIRKKSP